MYITISFRLNGNGLYIQIVNISNCYKHTYYAGWQNKNQYYIKIIFLPTSNILKTVTNVKIIVYIKLGKIAINQSLDEGC